MKRLIPLSVIAAAFVAAGAGLKLDTSDRVLVDTSASTPDAETRRLESALRAAPGDVKLTLELGWHKLTLGRAGDDARLLGQAEALAERVIAAGRAGPDAYLLRATLRQNRHEFDGALADLDHVLRVVPRAPAAWLTRASILAVQGQPGPSAASCRRVVAETLQLARAACLAQARGRSGDPQGARNALEAAVQAEKDAPTGHRVWALDILAELAEHADADDAAERYYRTALAEAKGAAGVRNRYADLLLRQQRAADALALLSDHRDDGALARRAIASSALGHPVGAVRLDPVRHAGEAARVALKVFGRHDEALELALENWRVQREPVDAAIVLEAAAAANKPAAAAPVLAWIDRTGLRSAALAPLHEEIEGELR